VAANFSNLDGMHVNIKILDLIILSHSRNYTPIDRTEDLNTKISYFYIDYYFRKNKEYVQKIDRNIYITYFYIAIWYIS